MPNPLVKLAMTGASLAAGYVGQKLLIAGWEAVFGEDAPTDQNVKQSAKDTKAVRKMAKKEGLTKEELQEIRDPEEDRPFWQAVLWTILTGVILQLVREAAASGTRLGAQKLSGRRPSPNRG